MRYAASAFTIIIKEAVNMKRDRFLLTLNDDSFDLILYSLIEMKNRLQSEGRYTDAADEALVRFLKAKRKYI